MQPSKENFMKMVANDSDLCEHLSKADRDHVKIVLIAKEKGLTSLSMMLSLI